MARRIHHLALLALLCLIPVSVCASETLNASHFTLKNGLEVVVLPQHRLPIVTHMLWFKAGAADEPPGKSGIAHYLEHMMFKGTKKLKEGEYSDTIERLGGEHNAFTSQDFTGYYVSIAREHLPKIMELEAERLLYLAPSEEAFLKERDVIMEERNSRIDNHPTQKLGEAMTAALFRNHPYRIPVIGWKHEILALTREDVMEYKRTHYYPNNAILLLAGDIEPEEARKLAARYYGRWRPADMPPRSWPTEPPLRVSQQLTLHHANVKQPQWRRYYPAPSLVSGDTTQAFALMMLEGLLGDGRASILHRELVEKRKIAVAADLSYNGFALGPGSISVFLTPAEGVSLQALGKAYEEVIARWLQTPPETKDLERVKSRSKADSIYARDGVEDMATTFGQLLMLGKDEAFFNHWEASVDNVTPEQVAQAAQRYLRDNIAVTGYLLPGEEER